MTAEERFEKHRRQDPHCTCNDCIAAMEAEQAREDEQADRIESRRRLTRTEQLQGLADRGIDTWEDYRGEK